MNSFDFWNKYYIKKISETIRNSKENSGEIYLSLHFSSRDCFPTASNVSVRKAVLQKSKQFEKVLLQGIGVILIGCGPFDNKYLPGRSKIGWIFEIIGLIQDFVDPRIFTFESVSDLFNALLGI